MQADWRMRSYRDGDRPGVAAIFSAGFKTDGVDIAYGDEDIIGMTSGLGFDAHRQTIVVDGPAIEGLTQGTVLGFGSVSLRDNVDDNSRAYDLNLAVHPAARETGLPRFITGKLLQIVRTMENDLALAASKVTVRDFLSPKSLWQKGLYEEIGLREVRRFYLMIRPLDSIGEPRPVEGIILRRYKRPQDDDATLEAYNDAFRDHFGSHANSRENWQHRLELPQIRLDLSWVAEIEGAKGKLAGFCLCAVYEGENQQLNRKWGFIELLGTVRDRRNKGVGRALILSGLRSLKGSGYETGALGVDTDSLTGANKLYESVGFKVHDLWLSYEAPLGIVKT